MAVTRTGSKRLLRDLNQSIVLNLLAQYGPLSRSEVARRSGLPPATITRIAGDFVAGGLVSEEASEEPSGGRRPTLLRINPTAGYVVGVKLREDSMTVALCDLQCVVAHQCEAPLLPGAAPYQAIEAIADAIRRCIEEAGARYNDVLGVGIGLSGLIDSEHGICRYSAILDWRGVEVAAPLEYKLRLPVHVDNDVNTLAVAERQFGAGRTATHFLLVTVGRGVGMGVVIGGEIYRGAHGGAGEFGHMTVDTMPDAPICSCGKRGCLEAAAADYGIVRAALGIDPGHRVEEAVVGIVERARTGDSAARSILARAGTALGVAIANLVNIFDPTLVIVTGEGLRAGKFLLEPLRAALPSHLFGQSVADVPLIVQPTNEVAWARGAASLVLREVFRPPIYETDDPLIIDDLLARARRSRRRARA